MARKLLRQAALNKLVAPEYMNCTTGDVEQIIGEAASLSERMTCDAFAGDRFPRPDSACSRLEAWLAQSSQGNSDKFSRRLAWDGLDIEDAHRIVQKDRCSLQGDPAWAPVLREMMAFLTSSPEQTNELFGDGGSTLPFVHVVTPLASFGMRSLAAKVPAGLLPETAMRDFRRQLLERLCEICDLTLGEEFLRYRLDRGWTLQESEASTHFYSSFVAEMRQGGLLRLFVSYPVLCRLVATVIGHWTDDIALFLMRLEADLPELERRLFAGRAIPPVRSIASSLSDPHNQGRTVKIITFLDGRRIVYKPKGLAIDEAWMGLVGWLRTRESRLDIRAPLVWNRGGYGWIEYIAPSACETVESIRNFYRNAGMLVCLLYVVQATDFHCENVIASGEHLVPIDLETLFVPDLKVLSKDSSRVAKNYWGTVLRSYLLPQWHAGADRMTAIDSSGIGSFADAQPMGTTQAWLNVNTDAMYFGKRSGFLQASSNLPSLAGRSVDPGEYMPEVVAGFALTYRALMQHRDALLSPGGPIEPFRTSPVRVVFRATRTYGTLLRWSLAPRFLRNGMDRSLEFEGLARPFLAPSEPYDGGPIFRSEIESLERLDIPYFAALTESDSLELGDGTWLPGVFDEPSFSAVTTRLRLLAETDLDYQIELIRSTFAARKIRLEAPGDRRSVGIEAEPLSSVELVATAEAIGSRVASRAIWEGNAVYWIGLDYYHQFGRHSVQPIGASLYSGRCGLALFFAGLHLVTGKDEYRALALGAVRSVTRELWGPGVDAETGATAARTAGIGGAAGLGGLVYSCVSAGRMLGEPALFEEAIRISKLISQDAVDKDQHLDVIGGTAGALLGLLSLWRATGEEAILDRVMSCATHLADHQQSGGANAGGWLTFSSRALTGFSHGAAGITYALCQAHAATGRAEFSDAARRGRAYEHSVFVPAESNWPDLRGACEGRSMGTWCHGAPGIGLARLGCLDQVQNTEFYSEIRNDIETAIGWLLASGIYPSDHLCCGELGRLELLLEAGRRLHRPDWIQHAQRRGAEVVARANDAQGGHQLGFWSTVGSLEANFVPGLFDGLAGIGYQMLRLASPDQIPSVLLWE